MRFDSFQAFLQMDGHGLFVWAAYGITWLLLLLNVWWPRRLLARILRAGKTQAAEQTGHPAGRPPGAGVEVP